MRPRYRTAAVAALFAALALGLAAWVRVIARPLPVAETALLSDAVVRVTATDLGYVFEPGAGRPDAGLVLYPGARVDPRAYAPPARALAEAGYLVVVASMPLNLPPLAPDRAADVRAAFPSVGTWVVGGHSLGGVMAARFALRNRDAVDGLVLWASYPAAGDDLSALDLPVATIYGTRDGLTTPDDVARSLERLPPDVDRVAVEGGNHAQFGWYGPQRGDRAATITREAQTEAVVAATRALLDRVSRAALGPRFARVIQSRGALPGTPSTLEPGPAAPPVMCGICGKLAYAPGAHVDERQIASMCATLRHRGPDDRGVHVDGRIGLGAARLSIIDLAGGHQPLANEDGTVWAVQNGEIYNYRALRAELAARGHQFATAGDTEVLVHLYEEFGDAFVERLRGMFALAVWDARAGRLVLARDRLGIKPLFYAEHDGALLFGSEIKALLAAGLPRRLDPVALHDYLSFDFVPGPNTMFDGISRLQAGHRLVWDGALKLERYWDLPPQPDGEAVEDNVEALTAQLRTRLEDAVASHMVSDVPVGAFLSGGLDSSIVVALMARLSDRPVQTYAVGFREKSYDELPWARKVAAHCGTEHHEAVIEPQVEDVIHRLVDAFDEPFADSSAVAAWVVAESAARHTKVVLSGDGGDEVFGGYVIYQADCLADLYRRLPPLLTERAIPRLVARLPVSDDKMSWDLKLRRFVEHARRDPLGAHASWRVIFADEAKPALYHRAFSPARHATLDLPRAHFDAYPGSDLLNRFIAVDTRISLVDDMLTKVDRTSMAHGLEVRVPLLDHHLVAWMSGIPSRYKVHGPRLRLKYLLKRAAAGLLPDDVIHRPKAGFHVPVPAWLKQELRPLVERQLGRAALERQGVFDPDRVAEIVAAHQADKANYSRNIWGLLMFSLWYDRHIART